MNLLNSAPNKPRFQRFWRHCPFFQWSRDWITATSIDRTPHSQNESQTLLIILKNEDKTLLFLHITSQETFARRIRRYVAVSATWRRLKPALTHKDNNMWRWALAWWVFVFLVQLISNWLQLKRLTYTLIPTINEQVLTGASLPLLSQINMCGCIAQTLTEQMLGHVFDEARMLRNVDVAYTHTLSIPGQRGALWAFLKRQLTSKSCIIPQLQKKLIAIKGNSMSNVSKNKINKYKGQLSWSKCNCVHLYTLHTAYIKATVWSMQNSKIPAVFESNRIPLYSALYEGTAICLYWTLCVLIQSHNSP